MEHFTTYLLLLVGILGVLWGARRMTQAACNLARRLGWSEGVIGVSILSLGTALPKITLAATAGAWGEGDLAIAIPFGALAASLGLVPALFFLFYRPEIKDRTQVRVNAILLLVSLVFVGLNLGLFRGIPQASGILLLALTALFLYRNIKTAQKKPSAKKVQTDGALAPQILLFFLGLLALGFGTWALTKAGVDLAMLWGLSPIATGILVLGPALVLPEIVVLFTALKTKSVPLSLRNLLGSGILVTLLGCGAAAAIRGVALSPILFSYHLPALFLMFSGILFFTLYGDRRYTRLNGFVLLFMYGTYLWIGTLTAVA